MKYIILIAFFASSFPVFAKLSCSKNGTTVIYTNGIQTSSPKAENDIDYLLHLKNSGGVNVEELIDLKQVNEPLIAYNYQESLAKDILESTVQKLPREYIKALKVTNAYAAFSHFIKGDLIETIAPIILNEIIAEQKRKISIFSRFFFNSPFYEQTINEGVPLYLSVSQRKEKILAISHSQGSLFMNDYYNLFSESDIYKRKFYAGFQIASVLGSEMPSHFGWATNEEDVVVNAVRFLLGTLPANLKSPNGIKTKGDILYHGIVSTYLFDDNLRAQVIEELFKTSQQVESNCNKAAITITKQESLKLSFDSVDPADDNVTDLKYEWDFGENPAAPIIVRTESKIISHTYKKSGTYTVKLRVVNNDGDTDTKEVDVIVRQAPKANIAYTKSNLAVNFDSTGNTDLTGLKYSWNFGDGQTANTKNPSHTYSQLGTYAVTLKVTNAYGDFMTAETSVTLTLSSNNVTFCHGSVDFRNNRYELFGPSSTLTVSIDESMSFSLYSDKLNCECQTVKLERGKNYRVSVTSTDLPLNKEEFMYEIIPNGRNRDTKVTPLNFNLYILDDYSVSIATRLSFNLDPYGKPYLRAEDTRYSFCKSYSYK